MIFIDLGAYTGDTVEQFINWGQILGDISDADIYAFEPSDYHEQWIDVRDRHIKHVKSITFKQEAAWLYDGVVHFSEADIGSTVMPTKNTWNDDTVKKAYCFDFSKWLKQFKGEEIYVKMDIEGAEIPVLEKMLQDGTDTIPTMMMIEWHGGKLGQDWRDRENVVKDKLTKWIEWR